MRGRVDLSRLHALPPGQLVWQTDPGSFDSMLIGLVYLDGSVRLIDVDQGMIGRNWDANGNFWISIAPASSALAAVDVVIERPQTIAVLRRMEIASYADSAAESASRTLLFAFIIGLLCIPMIYTFGHPTGDALLCQVARVLQSVIAQAGG